MMGIEQSAVSPFTDRVSRLKQLGGQVLNAFQHPIDTIQGALGIPLAPPPVDTHEGAIHQLNQQLNNQSVQDANKSFQPKPGLRMLKK